MWGKGEAEQVALNLVVSGCLFSLRRLVLQILRGDFVMFSEVACDWGSVFFLNLIGSEAV